MKKKFNIVKNRVGKEYKIPIGFVSGMGRLEHQEFQKTHLYKGTFDQPGMPMCMKGYNDGTGKGYSIFRNIVSAGGICKVCIRRAEEGLRGFDPWGGHGRGLLDQMESAEVSTNKGKISSKQIDEFLETIKISA